MKQRTHIAIVGSGITGLSTAYSLVGKGCRDIVIIEKGHLSSGASTRNGGGIRAQFQTEENIALAKWSIERFRRLGKELDSNFWFRQGGYLFVAESEEELLTLKRAAEFQRRFGLGTRIIDCEGVQTIVPDMVCRTVIGGSYRKEDGTLFPFPILFAYAEHLRAHDVMIETHCEVTKMERRTNGFEISTTHGPLNADIVLNAAGGWSRDVAAMMGFKLPTLPVRHQIMASEPLAPFLDPMVVTLKDGFYMSQAARGELIGGITESGAHGNDPRKSTTKFCQQMSSRMVSLFPRLSEARMLRQWAGFYDMSPDANPILDEVPVVNNLYVACGFSGHGFMISPAVGEFMASLLLGDKPPFPRDPYRLSRFELGKTSRETLVIG
jgi:sarcosine oxidase subunit beta